MVQNSNLSKMMIRFILLFIFVVYGSKIAAQEFNFPMTKLPTNDWQIINPNWTKGDEIQINPLDSKKIKILPGDNLIIANGKGEGISSKTQVGDVKVSFEFMLGDAGETIFYLGKYGIILNNSWKKEAETPCGSIIKPEGVQVPLQNTCLATGLWQKLELTFSTAQKNKPATFEKVTLNGITIHESYILGNSSAIFTPFSFFNKSGIIAIKNLEYLPLSDDKPLSITNLTYKVYDVWQWDNANNKPPKEEGNTENLTQEYATAYKNFSLIYTGNINVKTATKYLFSADFSGTFSFKIDGKEIISTKDFTYRIPQSGAIDLSQGVHQFELRYARAWWKPALGLFVTAAGIRPYALHIPTSRPEPDAVGEIDVTADAEVERIRSFILFDGKKRTHAISVGSPQDIHYSFDLNQGALLYAWRGEFADLTDMWYERGEPQLLRPKGATIKFSGKPNLAILANENASFPDSLDSFTELVYRGYSVDNQGFPSYNFDFLGANIIQKIIPQENGLTQSIEVKGTTNNLYCKIDEGKIITQIDKNLYLVDNHFIKVPEKVKVILRNSKSGQELITALQNSVSYSIIW